MPLDQRYVEGEHSHGQLVEQPPETPGVRYGYGRRDYYSRREARERLREKGLSWHPCKASKYFPNSPREIVLRRVLHSRFSSYIHAAIKHPKRMDVMGELANTIRCAAPYLTPRILTAVPGLGEFYQAYITLLHADRKRPEWERFAQLPLVEGYFPKAKDDGRISYYVTAKDLITGKRTITTAGRYLKRVYPTLSDHRIRDLANIHNLEYVEPEVKIARSESECIRVVAEGPESCMANSNYGNNDQWFAGHIHPAAVYGYCEDNPEWAPDTEILYIEDAKGKIKARVICNAITKACARIYGDETKMSRAMVNLGYRQEAGALSGARIRRIDNENEDDGIILPYVDAGVGSGGGDLRYVDEDDEYLRLTLNEGDQTYRGYENRGVSVRLHDEDLHTCESCGDEYSFDDMNSTHTGDYVCDGCLNDGYVYAAVGMSAFGSLEFGYVPDGHATEVAGHGAYWDDALEECYIFGCQHTGEYFHLDDLCVTPEGYALVDHVVELDEEYDGCDWAMPRHTTTTHDGRTIHEDHAVRDYFDSDIVYCEDDEGIAMVSAHHAVTAESVFENIAELSVIDGSLRLDKADLLSIPLSEYLMDINRALPVHSHPGGQSDMNRILTEVREMLLNKEETECEETEQMAA